MKSRIFSLLLVIILIACATARATDLRGVIDGPDPATRAIAPLVGVSIALFLPGPNSTYTLVHRTTTGPGGLYYFAGVAAGDYVLQVDGKNYPIKVGATPQQDIALIHK